MKPQPLVVLGGGTYREIHQLIGAINESGRSSFEVIALLDDDSSLHGREIRGVRVTGPLNSAHGFPEETGFAMAINNNQRRIQRLEILKRLGLPPQRFPALVHPSVVIDESTKIGHGAQVYQFSTTACGVEIGDFAMISPFTLFALDCQVGAGVLTGARVTALGRTKLGACAFIGTGTVIVEGVKIGPAAFVGAGSLVMNDVLPGHFTMGHPAQDQIRNITVPADLLDSWERECLTT